MREKLIGRYAVFALGAVICATGIAFLTRAGLGTSPISGLPFVLSLITPLSMGVYTLAFNLFFLLCEAVLRRCFTWRQAMQIPATLLFSACIDQAMAVIPTRYGGPWLDSFVYLVAGCLIMAFGIALEVKADVIMLPGEAFVRALSRKLGREFGNVKVCFDTTLAAAAAVVALFAFGRLNGVREGTLLSALAVGQLVKGYGKLLGRWKI